MNSALSRAKLGELEARDDCHANAVSEVCGCRSDSFVDLVERNVAEGTLDLELASCFDRGRKTENTALGVSI